MIELQRPGKSKIASYAGATRAVFTSCPWPGRIFRPVAPIDNSHADAAIALPHFYNLTFHRHLLEVGGDGTWAISAATMYTNLQATILTSPNAVRATSRGIAAAGLSARVEVKVGNPSRGRLPEGRDVILAVDILHRGSAEENQALLKRLRAAAHGGARLLLAGHWTGAAHTGALSAALTGEPTLDQSEHGDACSVDQTRRWLHSTGWHYFWGAPLSAPYNLIVADAV